MVTLKGIIRIISIGLFFMVFLSGAFAQSKIKLRSNHADVEYFRIADFSEEFKDWNRMLK